MTQDYWMSPEARDALREEWVGMRARGNGIAHVLRNLDIGQKVLFPEFTRHTQLSNAAHQLHKAGHGYFAVRIQRSLVDGSVEGIVAHRISWGEKSTIPGDDV